MIKQLLRGAVGAAFCTAALLAQAGTVKLTGWTYGGNTVSFTTPTSTSPMTVSAGGFTGSISDFGSFNNDSFQTYCVELTQTFSFSSTSSTGMGDYAIFAGADYGEWNLYGGNAAATSARLGKLMTYVNMNGAVKNASESTSLQLAIWNIIYDTDSNNDSSTTAPLSGGGFHADPLFASYADDLLRGSSGTASNLNVYVLKSVTSQDFLVTTPVPEPSSYALLFTGLAGIGLITRRRRTQS